MASAHHADIVATASCATDGSFVVDWTASAWQTDDPDDRDNPDVRVSASVDGGAANQVAAGAFNAGNGFAFSGQFNVPAGATSVEVIVNVVANWTNGTEGGQSSSTNVNLPVNCTPTTTTTSTTTTTVKPTTTTSTTTTTTSTTTSTTSTTTTTTLPPPGDDGCTPGYWKNHLGSWQVYTPDQTVGSVFNVPASYGLGSNTLLQALSFNGGSDTTGAARILLRAGTAALLNAAHSGVDYPSSTADVIAAVDAALASNDRDSILALAAGLDADNNLGCTLN